MIVLQRIIDFFANTDWFEIVKILITIGGTYYLTRFSLMKPLRIEVKKQQLEKVFLPLYKITQDDLASMYMPTNELLNRMQEIIEILTSNVALVNNDIYKSAQEFIGYSDTTTNVAYNEAYKRICLKIHNEYELIKHSLGYPSIGLPEKKPILKMKRRMEE